MTDLLQAAETLLTVIGSDHSQADYQAAVSGLAQAVTDAGGTIDATGAPAPGHAPSLAEAGPADLAPLGSTTEPAATTTAVAPHDQAVADAQAAVAQVTDGVDTPAPAPPDQHASIIAKAQADLAAALVEWPDSPQLQDLKTQLDAVAGETA